MDAGARHREMAIGSDGPSPISALASVPSVDVTSLLPKVIIVHTLVGLRNIGTHSDGADRLRTYLSNHTTRYNLPLRMGEL
jgi:hypothetical protein